jgi:hypothetical protein
MSPRNPHRRSRRRSRPGRLALFVCVLLVVALLAGGIARIGHQSAPYDANLNRSFAAQASVLADQSNLSASSLRHLMDATATLSRLTLQADLDGLGAQADDQATRAAALSTGGGVQGQFSLVLAERAQGVTAVRAALDGLLGLQTLPVAGAPALVTKVHGGATLLSSTQASNRIAAAGSLLVRGDRTYASLRHTLARAAGHARLPASKWITDQSVWQMAAVTAQVNLLVTSPALEVSHQLVLSVVQVTPPALPSPTGAATPPVSILSPTTTVVLNVVLSNLGSVDEPKAVVTFSLAPQPTGATATASRRTALAASRSVSLAPVSFKVKPGSSYQLTVAIGVPAGQADTAQTSVSEVLQIAPST